MRNSADKSSSENNDCEHPNVQVAFNPAEARGLTAEEVRKRWPRFYGHCPDCGDRLIKYASYLHYTAGDW